MRFGGVARLYGETALAQLISAHMVVIGLGGVGSWTAEALARTGVGRLTLIEYDEICLTNINRQVHALSSSVGQPKLNVVARRLRDINPAIKLHLVEDFLSLDNMTELILPSQHVVVDATDAAHIKAALIAYCCARKIRILTVGASGGKREPGKVQVVDLAKTRADSLLAKVRSDLYRHHHFARRKTGQKFRIDAVYSPEQRVYPQPDGSVCMQKTAMEDGVRLDCASGFGASVMVTASFGLAAAARAVERYLSKVNS